MRLLLVMAALAAALFATIGSGRAEYNGRWCAVVNIGKGGLAEDCSYRTLEACVPHVIAGNRGICSENPRYAGEPVKRVKRHRAY